VLKLNREDVMGLAEIVIDAISSSCL
jgi:hypothetical protein